MKPTMMFALVPAAVLVALVFGFKNVSTANASMSGMPVICNNAVPESTTSDLECKLPDGSTFTTVPASNYFFITDVHIMGSTLGSWTSIVSVKKYDMGWTTSDYLGFAGAAQENRSEHFTTPGMLALAGEKMTASNGGTLSNIRVKVSGILTTNYIYVPMIQR